MRKTLTLALLSLIMVACSQEEPIITPENMYKGKQSEHRVSLDDALKTADALLSQIGKPGTRSKSRRVANVKYLTSVATRSGAIDTTLYLVNYENNEGFALLGADDRVRPVYAISDEGQLNMSDTIENKGLAMFFQNTEADITGLTGPYVPIDSNIYIPQPPINSYEYEIYRQTEPLLNYYQNRWHQQAPYNAYCPVIDDTTTVVGCMAVAIGQIMAYHQYPTSVGTKTFNWDEINSGRNNDQLAQFFRLLGNPENLNMTYRKSMSYSYKSNAQRTFMNLGYSDPGSYLDFNEEAIIEILEKGELKEIGGGPVYVDGRYDSSGHAWVIDGYLQYNKITNNVLCERQDILFHCVWGWGAGTNNGYFYWSKTESLGGEAVEYDEIDKGTFFGGGESYHSIDYLPIICPVQ